MIANGEWSMVNDELLTIDHSMLSGKKIKQAFLGL